MITVRGVPAPGTYDAFEDGLLLPIPGDGANSIVLEERDGSDIRRLTAKSFALFEDGKKVCGADDIRLDVFITDARLALACSKYEKGGTWFGGVTALALTAGERAVAAVRRRGKMLVGHVRYPWIAKVGSTSKFGWTTEERMILRFKTQQGVMADLYLTFPKHADAAGLAAEVAQRAAAYRLISDPDLKAKEIARLEELGRALRIVADPSEKTVINFHVFPNFFTVGEHSARLTPRAAFLSSADGRASLGRQGGGDATWAPTHKPVAAASVRGTPVYAATPQPAAGTKGGEQRRTSAFCTGCGAALGRGCFCTTCGKQARA